MDSHETWAPALGEAMEATVGAAPLKNYENKKIAIYSFLWVFFCYVMAFLLLFYLWKPLFVMWGFFCYFFHLMGGLFCDVGIFAISFSL